MMRILVLNGPNLNLLGRRNPAVYGHETLADIERRVRERARGLDVEIEFLQTNDEGALIDALHGAMGRCVAAVLNPGGYAHTSVALRDAVEAVGFPVVEVHLSNLAAREPFRHYSLVGSAVRGSVSGLGAFGYELALEAAARLAGVGERA